MGRQRASNGSIENPLGKYLVIMYKHGKRYAYERVRDGIPVWTDEVRYGKQYKRIQFAQNIINKISLNSETEDNSATYDVVPAIDLLELRYIVKLVPWYNQPSTVECDIVWYDKGQLLADSFTTKYEADNRLRKLCDDLIEESYQRIFALNKLEVPDITKPIS